MGIRTRFILLLISLIICSATGGNNTSETVSVLGIRLLGELRRYYLKIFYIEHRKVPLRYVSVVSL